MDSNLMTLREVAERIKLNEKAVSKLAQTGEITAAKVGGQWRFQTDAVDAWLAHQPAPAAAEQQLSSAATGMPAVLSVAGAISLNRINLNLAAASRDGVLRELVGLVIAPQDHHLSETLFKALKAREDLCPTCIQEGIAVPHARNALVGLVDQPVLAYGRHRAGVDFGALDGKRVHHFFLLCAPNVREHLQVLARLARLLNQPDIRARLEAVSQPGDLVELLRVAEQAAG